MYAAMRPASPLRSRRGVAAVDDDVLDLAGAVAAEGCGRLVLGRVEAGDRLLEGRKLDHHVAGEFLRTFHDLKTPAARQHLAAVLVEDRPQRVGVLLVFDRIDHARARYPIGRHRKLLGTHGPDIGTLRLDFTHRSTAQFSDSPTLSNRGNAWPAA